MTSPPISDSSSRAAAFTLVELLVVIAIIAILAGLSFGALNRISAKADDVTCLSHLRQIGIAIQLYVNDNGTYPAGSFENGPYAYWPDAVQPYLEKEGVKWAKDLTEVFDCPAKTIPTAQPESAYTVNPRVMPDEKGSSARQLASHLMVKRPSEVILLTDACQRVNGKVTPFMWQQPGLSQNSESKANDPMPVGTDQDGINYAGIRYRHQRNSAANFLFADGHAAPIKKGELLHKNISINY